MTKTNIHKRLVLLFAMSGAICTALAQESGAQQTTPGVTVETIAERYIQAEGGASHEFVRADQLQVGDEIFYTLRVRNVTDAPLSDVIVIRAIPRNTQYVEGSAVGPAAIVTVSIDGGASFSEPGSIELQVAPATLRPATSDDYTHLRWELRYPLASGATALLRFRGIFR